MDARQCVERLVEGFSEVEKLVEDSKYLEAADKWVNVLTGQRFTKYVPAMRTMLEMGNTFVDSATLLVRALYEGNRECIYVYSQFFKMAAAQAAKS